MQKNAGKSGIDLPTVSARSVTTNTGGTALAIRAWRHQRGTCRFTERFVRSTVHGKAARSPRPGYLPGPSDGQGPYSGIAGDGCQDVSTEQLVCTEKRTSHIDTIYQYEKKWLCGSLKMKRMDSMIPGLVMWLLGVPLVVVILLWLFHVI